MELLNELKKDNRGGAYNIKHGLWARYEKGEITLKEYLNYNAKQKGFKDWNEQRKIYPGYKDIHISLSERKDCSAYLGVYIAENILPYIFETPEKMPYGNEGFDAICKRGFKIDVKSSCLINSTRTVQFYFHIDENKVADYFIMFGFDNRTNLNLLHIWLIKSTEIIRERKLSDFKVLVITNSIKSLYPFRKYEIVNKLDKIQELCRIFVKENNSNCKEVI